MAAVSGNKVLKRFPVLSTHFAKTDCCWLLLLLLLSLSLSLLSMTKVVGFVISSDGSTFEMFSVTLSFISFVALLTISPIDESISFDKPDKVLWVAFTESVIVLPTSFQELFTLLSAASNVTSFSSCHFSISLSKELTLSSNLFRRLARVS